MNYPHCIHSKCSGILMPKCDSTRLFFSRLAGRKCTCYMIWNLMNQWQEVPGTVNKTLTMILIANCLKFLRQKVCVYISTLYAHHMGETTWTRTAEVQPGVVPCPCTGWVSHVTTCPFSYRHRICNFLWVIKSPQWLWNLLYLCSIILYPNYQKITWSYCFLLN